MRKRKQPEALRLATLLDHYSDRCIRWQAVVELRRQHEEIESLRTELAGIRSAGGKAMNQLNQNG